MVAISRQLSAFGWSFLKFVSQNGVIPSERCDLLFRAALEDGRGASRGTPAVRICRHKLGGAKVHQITRKSLQNQEIVPLISTCDYSMTEGSPLAATATV
jgi:hypothetical protein